MRLLVTRPEPGASRTAAALAALGHAPVVLPLSRVVAIAPASLPDGIVIDLVAASSANAVRHAPPSLLAALSRLPCHVVGETTALAAREAGLRVVDVAAGAAALGERLARAVVPGARLAYLCGRVRLATLEARSTAAGIEVFAIETYDTEPVSYSADELAARLAGPPFDGVLLYSRIAAGGLRTMLAGGMRMDPFADARLFCLSPGIADALGETFAGSVAIAGEPSEEALLARIGPAR